MRIFGDVRAFECSPCDFTLLLAYPFEAMFAEQPSESLLDAAE
jgi:hypothetical protein